MFSKIEHPYTFTDDEKSLIRDNYAVHTDWDKSVFDNIKSNITQHLRNEQDNECCYCRQKLGFDIGESFFTKDPIGWSLIFATGAALLYIGIRLVFFRKKIKVLK